MITLKRVDYAFAELNATPEEWAAVQRVLRHAVEHYNHWDLYYTISGPAELRFGKLQSMAERMLLHDPLPIAIHKENVDILFCIGFDLIAGPISGVSQADCQPLCDHLTRHSGWKKLPDYPR